MKIKGSTKIELTNVRTGETEVYEGENFVTEFASEYFKECGALNTDPLGSLPTNARPLDDLFGGIMLFDKKIDQNTDEAGNHPHPLYCPAGTTMVANGSIDFTSNSNATELGQYDDTESGTPNEHQRVYVYNWDTDEGNGKINSVCLTTRAGGYIGAGNATSKVKDSSTSALVRSPFFFAGTTTRNRTFTGDLTKLAGLDLSQSQVAMLGDTAKNCLNAGSATINWYDVPVSKLQPFINKINFNTSNQSPRRTQTKTFTARTTVTYARVMGGTGYILLVGSTSTGATSGATVYATQLNKDGTITEKTYNMQANAGIALNDSYFVGGKIIGNDLYLAYGSYGGQVATKRVKIKADGTVVDLSTTNDYERFFSVHEGRVGLGSTRYYDPTLTIPQGGTEADRIVPTNASKWNSQSGEYIMGIAQCYDCNLFFGIYGTSSQAANPLMSPLTVMRPPCNWLSTIKNLPNEVEKTPDKTMKVTYTLTLVENQQT